MDKKLWYPDGNTIQHKKDWITAIHNNVNEVQTTDAWIKPDFFKRT